MTDQSLCPGCGTESDGLCAACQAKRSLGEIDPPRDPK